jgi:ubiquinone/menaquinone biosynthesis C-methylase UbiE
VEASAGFRFRLDHSGSAVKRFGYVFDPLFLICCGLYAANRWLIKPHCQIAFFHNWFNDLLLIPCALPVLLLAHRALRLRGHDGPPTAGEVAAHVIGWSVLFELIGPHIMPTVGDPWDAVSYAVGGLVAFFWWRTIYSRNENATADFEGLAPHYGWMEKLLAGRKLHRCRAAFLAKIPEPRKALIAGPGHGKFVVDLLRAYPQTRCTCIDSSQGMLEATRAGLRENRVDESRVEFIHGDFLEWDAPRQEFDLIVTHFFLDCFDPGQLDLVMAKLASAATPAASWLVADFNEPASGLAKWRARAIIEMMYVFFRWATNLPASQLTPPDGRLARQGFRLGQRLTFDWGLLHSDLWTRAGATPSR